MIERLRRGVVTAIAFAALSATPVLAQSAAPAQDATDKSFGGLKLSGDKPIQIESDKLEVHDNDSTAYFTGNVNVVQGDMLLKAGKMIVHYVKGSGTVATGAAGINSIEVDDKVYIKSNDQIVTGDKGNFDMKSQILTLQGDQVVLTQGKNVVVGCKLTANMANGQSFLDGCPSNGQAGSGRVKVLLTPKKEPAE